LEQPDKKRGGNQKKKGERSRGNKRGRYGWGGDSYLRQKKELGKKVVRDEGRGMGALTNLRNIEFKDRFSVTIEGQFGFSKGRRGGKADGEKKKSKRDRIGKACWV